MLLKGWSVIFTILFVAGFAVYFAGAWVLTQIQPHNIKERLHQTKKELQ